MAPIVARGSRLSRWLTLALLILIPIVSSLADVLRPGDAAPACGPRQVVMAGGGHAVQASLERNGAGSVLLRLCTSGATVTSWTASHASSAVSGEFVLVRVGQAAAIGSAALPGGGEWVLTVGLTTDEGEHRTVSATVRS